ncbi:hypothetical protein LOD99_6781 [Oopsacas minuta]|uniref:Uncharacterized protein n=1 Tax=Oopsacas minuta TaxID=111878 RepID=A0AAV7JKW3_9METZ|nr:hypothetical protein LOD99_6781 [Oopsacas minuta]
MASAQQPTTKTKRRVSQDEVSSDPADTNAGLKKQKLDPPSEEVQPDSTEPRDVEGFVSSGDSILTEVDDVDEVDLEDASEGDSDDLDGSGKIQSNVDGEEFDDSHSGDQGDDDDSTGGEGTGDDSEEELPIIEGTEVELIHQSPEAPLDGDNEKGAYLLKGKGGRVLKLAISENAISEVHTECLLLFESGKLPRIQASDLEVISDSANELTVHASTVTVSTSYPVKKYSKEELDALEDLDQHLLATERDWCIIEVAGYDTLFGSKDLMPED